MLFLGNIQNVSDGKNLATYHDNFCVKKYFIPKKYISTKKQPQKFKIARYLHHESAGAKHLSDRKSQAAMQFHISFQILSRSIAGRARIDERGLRLTAYWSRSPPMNLQQVETCHQKPFPVHVRKEVGTTINFQSGQCLRISSSKYLLKPLVLLRGTAWEPVLWISIHKIKLCWPWTSDLLLGDAVWPEPRSVNVTTGRYKHQRSIDRFQRQLTVLWK